ncbi:MAG TPA: M24 family metallopeptidase C-terminal domain-containing protein, partial [Kaistella sp.]|nr:M24 family metallopeptidase C-terminal domain-containing protein [Kaistella sp.]
RKVIDVNLLTEPEKQWLNNYHQWCEEKLAADLEGDVKDWFLEVVKPI